MLSNSESTRPAFSSSSILSLPRIKSDFDMDSELLSTVCEQLWYYGLLILLVQNYSTSSSGGVSPFEASFPAILPSHHGPVNTQTVLHATMKEKQELELRVATLEGQLKVSK